RQWISQHAQAVAFNQRLELIGYAQQRDLRQRALLLQPQSHQFDGVVNVRRNLLKSSEIVRIIIVIAESHALGHLRNRLLRPEAPTYRRKKGSEAMTLNRLTQLQLEQFVTDTVIFIQGTAINGKQPIEKVHGFIMPPLNGVKAVVGDAVGIAIVAALHGLFGKLAKRPLKTLIEQVMKLCCGVL